LKRTGNKNASSTGSTIYVSGFQIVGIPLFAGPPVVNAGGVVNGATFVPAPNNQVERRRDRFDLRHAIPDVRPRRRRGSTSADATWSDNTKVTACGRDLPLFNAFTKQMNVQIPWECPATGASQVTVTVNGQTSAAETFNLAPRAPGIFVFHIDEDDRSTTGRQLYTPITRAFGRSATLASARRFWSSVLVRSDQPGVFHGAAASSAHFTVDRVTATIDGIDAPVVYSGLAQGFVGLYQVNMVVPSGLTHHLAPIVVRAGGFSSQSGLIISVIRNNGGESCDYTDAGRRMHPGFRYGASANDSPARPGNSPRLRIPGQRAP